MTVFDRKLAPGIWTRINTLSDRGLFFFVSGMVLAARLPFLDAGYGTAPDSWRLARSAMLIGSSGEYVASRLPGYPLPEIISSLLWRCEPIILNGATALMSAFAAGFLALTLRTLQSPAPILCALAFAMTPLIYLNSVVTLDVMWAIAFISASFFVLTRKMDFWAGVLLGCAIASRITSGAALLPFLAFLFLTQGETRFLRRGLILTVTALVVAALWFIPVVATYGAGFWTFSEYGAYPDWSRVKWMLMGKTWGDIGFYALAGSAILAIGLRVAQKYILWLCQFYRFPRRDALVAGGVGVALFLGAFFTLPHERYLAPVVFFGIILFGQLADTLSIRVLAIGLILSGFFSYAGGHTFRQGMIFEDFHQRQKEMATIEGVISTARALEENATVVVGWWLPQIQTMLLLNGEGHEKFVYLLDSNAVATRSDSSAPLYFLSGIDSYNLQAKGIDLHALGASELVTKRS